MKKTLTYARYAGLLMILMLITTTALAATPNYQYLSSSVSGTTYVDVANTHFDPNNPDIAYVYAMHTDGNGVRLYTTYTYDYKNRTKCVNSSVAVYQGKSRILFQGNTKAVTFQDSKEKDFDEIIARRLGRTTLASNDNEPNNINKQINNQVNTIPPSNNTGEKRLGVSVHVSKAIAPAVAECFRTAIMNSYGDYLNPGFSIINGDELDTALKNSTQVKNRNANESEDSAITSLYCNPPLLIDDPRWQSVRGFNLNNLLLFQVSYLQEGNTIYPGKYSITISGVSFPNEDFDYADNHHYQGTIEEIVEASFKDFLNRYDRSPGDALDQIIQHESEGGGYYRSTLVDTES